MANADLLLRLNVKLSCSITMGIGTQEIGKEGRMKKIVAGLVKDLIEANGGSVADLIDGFTIEEVRNDRDQTIISVDPA